MDGPQRSDDQNLRARMAHLEDQFQELANTNHLLQAVLANVPQPTRRQALSAAAMAIGVSGAGAGFIAGQESARADAVGQVGTSADPLTKLWAHELESGDGATELQVTDTILPDADNTRDLGASGTQWSTLFANSVDAGALTLTPAKDNTSSFNGGETRTQALELGANTPVIATAFPAEDPDNDLGFSVDAIFWDDSFSDMFMRVTETENDGGGMGRFLAWELGV